MGEVGEKTKKREGGRTSRRKGEKMRKKMRKRVKGGFLKELGEDVGGGGSDRPDRKMGRENARGEHIQLRKMKFFLAKEDF